MAVSLLFIDQSTPEVYWYNLHVYFLEYSQKEERGYWREHLTKNELKILETSSNKQINLPLYLDF
jgi:hypothetical protein